MSLPGFIQTETNEPASIYFGARFVSDGSQYVAVPAMRGDQEEAYNDCLVDCRLARGKNCPTACAKIISANVGYGVSPGTSPATELCCMATFFGCVALNLGNYVGLLKCGYDSFDCADKPPCNTATWLPFA